jgi:hypothetical protein
MKRWPISGELAEILEKLRSVDDSAVSGGVSTQFLEVAGISEKNGGELHITGNPQGLVHFARLILDIAVKGYEGAHVHLDESANLDKCDVPVVVSLKAAEWDQP